jgi:hypothetical protein
MSFSPEYKTYVGEEPITSVAFKEILVSKVAFGDTVLYELPNQEE